jgi:thiol-disulfide isomerase/thioredoxin
MKKNKVIFCHLIAILLFQGCNLHGPITIESNKKFDSISIPQGKPVKIYGVINNRDVYTHVTEVTLEIPDFSGFEKKYTTPIEPDGSFKFQFYPITTREVSLKPIADVLIVHPGDSLFIVKDFKDISGAKFSGDASELNDNVNIFLNRFYLGRYISSKNDLNPQDYKQFCESFRNDAYTRLAIFQKEHNSSEEFSKWAKSTIDIDYYTALLHYLMYKKLSSQTKIDYPSDYYAFMEDLTKTFNTSVICSNYFKLINNYFNDYLVPTIIKKYIGSTGKNHKRDSLFINEIANFSKNDLINQFALSHYFNSLLNTHSAELFEENSSFITSKIKEPFLLKTLQDRYKYLKDYITNPRYLSDAMLGRSDFDNKSIAPVLTEPFNKDLINRIISNNKNTAIYIDFWAAWCPPCIPELQISKKLIQKYAGKNIEFIFICLSDSIAAKQKIHKLDLGGTHYFCTSTESIYLQNNYGFQSIPHYLLIDSTGTIIDFGGSLRPSNSKTIEKLDKLTN